MNTLYVGREMMRSTVVAMELCHVRQVVVVRRCCTPEIVRITARKIANNVIFERCKHSLFCSDREGPLITGPEQE